MKLSRFSLWLWLLAAMLIFCISASASTVITATLSVTNVAGSTNGNVITINGNSRYCTNAIYAPATQFAIGTNATLATSALLNHVATYPFSSLALGQTALTNITLQAAPDASLAVTLSAGWGFVSFVTNTVGVGSGTLVRMPLSSEPD